MRNFMLVIELELVNFFRRTPILLLVYQLHLEYNIVTSVPSVTNVYYFFMDCRDAYRFVRCGFVYVNVCYGAAFMYAAAQLCGPAYVLPRTRMLPLIRGAAFVYAAARLCSRAYVVPRTRVARSRNAAAHSYVAAHL